MTRVVYIADINTVRGTYNVNLLLIIISTDMSSFLHCLRIFIYS